VLSYSPPRCHAWDHEPLLPRTGETFTAYGAYDGCYVVLTEMLGAELHDRRSPCSPPAIDAQSRC
jgi:hypothetical protein